MKEELTIESTKKGNRNPWRVAALATLVGIIVATLAVAVFSFIYKRHGMTAKEACLHNLRLIEASKAEWDREANRRNPEKAEQNANQVPVDTARTLADPQH